MDTRGDEVEENVIDLLLLLPLLSVSVYESLLILRLMQGCLSLSCDLLAFLISSVLCSHVSFLDPQVLL